MEGLSNDQVLGVTLFWLMWPCKKIAISMSLIASWDAMLNRNSVQNRQMSCCGKPLVHKSPAAFSINMSLLYVIRNVFWNRLLLWNICHHNRRRASSPSLSFCYCDSALFTQFILLPCISASSTIGYPAGLCALNQIHSVEFLFWRFTKGGFTESIHFHEQQQKPGCRWSPTYCDFVCDCFTRAWLCRAGERVILGEDLKTNN